MTAKIRAYDHGRAETVSQLGGRLIDLVTLLAKQDGRLSDWHWRDNEGVLTPLESTRDCVEAITRGARTWKSGQRELVAYGVTAVAGTLMPRAELEIACGLEPFPVWVPNQLELTLGPWCIGAGAGDAAVLQGAFEAVVEAYAPAWGVVEVDGRPLRPVPPFSNGTPTVGWMTYLSTDYPYIPPLREPVVCRPMHEGSILIAHPSSPDPESIEQLRLALEEAQVLVAAAELKHRR